MTVYDTTGNELEVLVMMAVLFAILGWSLLGAFGDDE